MTFLPYSINPQSSMTFKLGLLKESNARQRSSKKWSSRGNCAAILPAGP